MSLAQNGAFIFKPTRQYGRTEVTETGGAYRCVAIGVIRC